MADNNYFTLVNEKLASVRALLVDVKALDTHTVGFPLKEKTYLESAAVFLYIAYQQYLRELATQYGVKNAAVIGDEQQLLVALKTLGKEPSEAVELFNLSVSTDTWLQKLKAAHNNLYAGLPEPSKPAKAFVEANLIAAQQLDGEPVRLPLTLAAMDEWHRSLYNLLERQRASSVEY